MNENQALIEANELNLPEEKKQQLLRQASVGSISYLSPDREAAPFMLFCCGESIDEISGKLSIPKDIILLTAMHYKWVEKSQTIRQDPAAIQQSLVNNILVATAIAAQEELKDLLSGKKKASQCKLIPKNPAALEKLLNMVNMANGIQAPQPASGTTIHAQNVQINNTSKDSDKDTDKRFSETQEEKEAKYDKLTQLTKK